MKKQERTYTLLPSETVLPDDYPVMTDFIYIVDGVITRQSNYFDITVLDWKRMDGIKEVRRCSLFAREEACLGDKVSIP
jgi:hypothetical protein